MRSPSQVDDLPRLAQAERDGVVERGVRVGADEAVLLAHARDLLLDRSRGLIPAFARERRGANEIAHVFDRLGLLRRSRAGRAAAEQGPPKRHEAPPT